MSATTRTVDIEGPIAFPPSGIIAELQREIAMRERLYPKWVAEGKLSTATASIRIAILKEVERIIRAVFADELRPDKGSLLENGER